MAEEHEQQDELDPEELERANGEPLPDREAMSIITPDVGSMPPVPLDPTE